MTKAINPLASRLFRMAWKSSLTVIFLRTKYYVSKRPSSIESARAMEAPRIPSIGIEMSATATLRGIGSIQVKAASVVLTPHSLLRTQLLSLTKSVMAG